MDIAAHIDALEHEASELGAAAAATSLADPVPGCPDWTVRDLIRHIGYVHRWAGAIVSGQLDGASGDGDAAVGALPADDGLHGWYDEGHRGLVATLRAAPADLECFTFLPAPSPLAFWARRQALETAVHRADASAAAGRPVEFHDDLAHDGIDETLRGFGTRPRAFEPGSIWLQPGDGSGWRSICTKRAQRRPTTPTPTAATRRSPARRRRSTSGSGTGRPPSTSPATPRSPTAGSRSASAGPRRPLWLATGGLNCQRSGQNPARRLCG